MLATAGRAAADANAGDFDPAGQTWNGLSGLLAIASELRIDLAAPETLSLDGLSPRDAVLIVGPTQALPRTGLTDFLRAGGRVAVADDFGPSGRFLRTFGIRRGTPNASDDERRLRGNSALQLATPAKDSPLSAGVPVVVTNHPSSLDHHTLEPVFTLGADQGAALVLTGAVGAGRLVAAADPSILINNMLAFPGNARFANNLLRYLNHKGGRVWILAGDATLTSSKDAGPLQPLTTLRKGLARLAEAELPPAALQMAAWVLAASMLMAAFSALPRRTDYGRAMPLRAQSPMSGVAGRMRFFTREARNFLAPSLTFKLELEHRLTRALALPVAARTDEVERAMRRMGVPEEEVQPAMHALTSLRTLAAADVPPRVGARRFADLVAAGTAILARLEGRRSR